MEWLIFVLCLVSVLVGAGRFTVPGHGASWPGTYEALAHVWVGVLIALACVRPSIRVLCIVLLGLITSLETFMFFHRGY